MKVLVMSLVCLCLISSIARAEITARPITRQASLLIKGNSRQITLHLLVKRYPESLANERIWKRNFARVGLQLVEVARELPCFSLVKVSGSPADFRKMIELTERELQWKGSRSPFISRINWIGTRDGGEAVNEIMRNNCD